MKKELSLAIPKSKLNPPPKKSEVIDALTKLRVDELNKEQKEQVAERKRLEEEIEPELIEYALSNVASLIKNVKLGYAYDQEKINGVGVLIQLDHKDLSKHLIDKLRRIHSLPERVRFYTTSDVRKGILMAVNGMVPHNARVSLLLEDEESSRALKKMLEVIG